MSLHELDNMISLACVVLWTVLKTLSDNNPEADYFEMSFLRKCCAFKILFTVKSDENENKELKKVLSNFSGEKQEDLELEKKTILEFLAKDLESDAAAIQKSVQVAI